MTSHKNSLNTPVRKMRPYFTDYWRYLIEKADMELVDEALEPEDLKEFWGLTRDSQLSEWLNNVGVFTYYVPQDESIALDVALALDVTGREFKNWLSDQENESRERYV